MNWIKRMWRRLQLLFDRPTRYAQRAPRRPMSDEMLEDYAVSNPEYAELVIMRKLEKEVRHGPVRRRVGEILMEVDKVRWETGKIYLGINTPPSSKGKS